MTSPPRILVLYAHPSHATSRVNRRLREHVQDLSNVRVHDLYEMYPDFHIDIAHEQQALEESDLIVMQHPVQWYSMPALLKEWIDVVFEHGWAYGHDGNALRGKDLMLVATTGSAAAAYQPDGYHRHIFDALLPPYEQTAHLCGMRWLPPLVVHGTRDVCEETMASQFNLYRERLSTYPTSSVQMQTPADLDPIGPQQQPGNPNDA